MALDVLLGRSDRAAVLLSAADVYPAGLLLRLMMLVDGELGDLDPGLFGRGAAPHAEAHRELRPFGTNIEAVGDEPGDRAGVLPPPGEHQPPNEDDVERNRH